MKISEFAERILLSSSIEEKLRLPGPLDYSDDSVYLHTPELPQRSAEFSFGKKSSKDIALGKLDSDTDRGHLLLFFMNHELLAIELMALALLKFKNTAPESFLRGLVSTLRDEQKHCRLYLNRIKQLGVEAGDLPLSRFFWDCLVDIEKPEEYLAGMALTLEQANLDFTLFYQERFKEVQDKQSAQILDTVYQDEIRHVAFGVSWMNQWKKPDTELWDYYLIHLPKRLNPARARGHFTFDQRGRQQAGMSEGEILQFKLFNSSRGRSPDLWYFNPAVENEVANLAIPKTFKALQTDLALIMFPLSKRDDIVLLNELPSVQHRNKLYEAGFQLPEFKLRKQVHDSLDNKVNKLFSWGLSPKLKVFNKELKLRNHHQLWNQDWQNFYSKSYQAEFWSETKLTGINDYIDLSPAKVVGSLGELRAELSILSLENHKKAFLKAPYGCTGRTCRAIDLELNREDDLTWVESILKKQGTLSIEPWREIITNLSAQFTLNEKGLCQFEGLTLVEMLNNKANAGNICGPFIKKLPKDVRRFLCSGSKNLARDSFVKCAQAWAKELHQKGFYGPFGLDGFIWRKESGELFFRPICELNPRVTMGRIALELTNDCSPGTLTKLSVLHSSQELPDETALEFDRSKRLCKGRLRLNELRASTQFHALFTCGADLV